MTYVTHLNNETIITVLVVFILAALAVGDMHRNKKP